MARINIKKKAPTKPRVKKPAVPSASLEKKIKYDKTKVPPVPKADLTEPLAVEKALTPEETATTPPAAVSETALPAENNEEESKLERAGRLFFALGTVGMLLILLITAMMFLVWQRMPATDKEPAKTQVQITVMPSPTPTPSSTRPSEITLEILNGSGVAGAAAKMATELGELGYQVVIIDNAETIARTTLWLAPGVGEDEKSIVDLREAINATMAAETLSDSTASARIIIGQNNK